MDLINQKSAILNQFQCQQSGNCCKASGYVYVSKSEITDMAKVLNLSEELFRKQFINKINGWDVIASPTFRTNCFLNSNNNCSVYEARPDHCRTYPNWPIIWESDSNLIKEAAVCPGLKKAINLITKKD